MSTFVCGLCLFVLAQWLLLGDDSASYQQKKAALLKLREQTSLSEVPVVATTSPAAQAIVNHVAETFGESAERAATCRSEVRDAPRTTDPLLTSGVSILN